METNKDKIDDLDIDRLRPIVLRIYLVRMI